jgi:hypothetical protein
MTKRLFCNIFDELFNERHLVPVLHDFYTHRRVLLILTINSYPPSTQSIIISKGVADVIKLMCEKYSKYEAYRAYSWIIHSYIYTLSKVDFKYIYDEKLVDAFEKIYGSTSHGCEHLYENVSNAIKVCFRKGIEKSANEYYNVHKDSLKLSDLLIVNGKIICDDSSDNKIMCGQMAVM